MTKRRILIVDDDVQYLSLLQAIIERDGVNARYATSGAEVQRDSHLRRQSLWVRYATSGAEALGILRESGCSLMITDLNMPGMDGFTLAKMAKEVCPDIVIVMITGEDLTEVPAFAEKSGISRVIAKPCRAEHLLEIVRG